VQIPVVIKDSQGRDVEKAMVVFHPAPRSYTGEDVSEISCHGNPLIVGRIMGLIRDTGLARRAEKGEFTRRAFLNGKLDLAQAEAVGALIEARSESGVEMAKTLLQGGLSRELESIAAALQGVLSEIEASFILEDVQSSPDSLALPVEQVASDIEDLLRGAENASRLYTGVITTIAGLPNAGKSSLFNAILGYPRAIVHEEEGTTRDILREHLTVSGIDFVFHDTAGIRTASSGPEEIGIRNTMEMLQKSHLVLYVVDATAGLSPGEEEWLRLGEKTITVMNKADLVEERPPQAGGDGAVWVSAKYGSGLDDLFAAMTARFPQDLPRIFLERHAYLLSRARESLMQFLSSARQGVTPDALAIDLGSALENIREITGEGVHGDILDRIFERFCVGK